MLTDDSFSLSITPKDVLYLRLHRRTDSGVAGGNAVIDLHNEGKCKLHYKLESNVPELYYFKPRYGCLDPGQEAKVIVYSLSYDLPHPSTGKQEILVRSMIAKNAKDEGLSQLWENTNPTQIRTHRLKCIPFENGELFMEPNRELMFEGPFDLPFSSTIHLTNRSIDCIQFDTLTSSTDLVVFPPDGFIWPYNEMDLIVIRKPLKAGDNNATSESIKIQTAMFPIDRPQPTWEMWSAAPKKETIIKCVYNTRETSPSVTDFQAMKNALQAVESVKSN
ncbi:unnamed protein product [Dicrocoelium dendriticum]|nr:unnamed protein product [Dicrocoelium dendriticum]